MPTTRPASRISRQASISRFSSNGIADLHARALVVVGAVGAEPGRREHAGPADAVPPGGRAEQHGQVPRARGPGEHEAVVGQEAEAEHVDERIVLIGGIEDGLTAHRRHADRVPIAGYSGHHSFGDPPASSVVQRTESEGIHERDGASTDREHIAQDARRRRSRRPRRARWPRGGCGSRSGRRRRCRRRRRRRRRPRPGPPARAGASVGRRRRWSRDDL